MVWDACPHFPHWLQRQEVSFIRRMTTALFVSFLYYFTKWPVYPWEQPSHLGLLFLCTVLRRSLATLHRRPAWDVFFWASQFPASVSIAPGDSPTQTSISLPATANLPHLPLPKRELSSPTPGSSQFTSV